MRQQTTLFVAADSYCLQRQQPQGNVNQDSKDLNDLLDHLNAAKFRQQWQLVIDDNLCLQQRITTEIALSDKDAYAYARLQAETCFGFDSEQLLIDCLTLNTAPFSLWVCACPRQRIDNIISSCSPKLGQPTAAFVLSLYTLQQWAKWLKLKHITTLVYISNNTIIACQCDQHHWHDIQHLSEQQLIPWLNSNNPDHSPYYLINLEPSSDTLCQQTLQSNSNGHWLHPWEVRT